MVGWLYNDNKGKRQKWNDSNHNSSEDCGIKQFSLSLYEQLTT